jgi:hypothetical protein
MPSMTVRWRRTTATASSISARASLTIGVGTRITASMWLGLEHNYRAGLTAGPKDVTDDD